jgi:hypothetical protein
MGRAPAVPSVAYNERAAPVTALRVRGSPAPRGQAMAPMAGDGLAAGAGPVEVVQILLA